jgi:hypothetical protein
MRTIAISIIGGAFGLAMIRLGFNLRFGGYGSSWWLSGADAYIPAAITGALIALFIDWTLRKRTL